MLMAKACRYDKIQFEDLDHVMVQLDIQNERFDPQINLQCPEKIGNL